MAWRLDGTYFENCNCEVVCPCTAADFAAPADHDRCRVLIAFHVDRGQIDGVDVAGMNVGVFADTPPMMIEGNWRVGLFMDGKASEQQAAKLTGVFSGAMGGPMAGLAPLIGEFLGVETAPIEYTGEGRHHSVKTRRPRGHHRRGHRVTAGPRWSIAPADRAASPCQLDADRGEGDDITDRPSASKCRMRARTGSPLPSRGAPDQRT